MDNVNKEEDIAIRKLLKRLDTDFMPTIDKMLKYMETNPNYSQEHQISDSKNEIPVQVAQEDDDKIDGWKLLEESPYMKEYNFILTPPDKEHQMKSKMYYSIEDLAIDVFYPDKDQYTLNKKDIDNVKTQFNNFIKYRFYEGLNKEEVEKSRRKIERNIREEIINIDSTPDTEPIEDILNRRHKFDRSYYPLLKWLMKINRDNSKKIDFNPIKKIESPDKPSKSIKTFMNTLSEGINKLPYHLQIDIKNNLNYDINNQLKDNIDRFIDEISIMLAIFINLAPENQLTILEQLSETNKYIYNFYISKSAIKSAFSTLIRKAEEEFKDDYKLNFKNTYKEDKNLIYDCDKFEMLNNHLISVLKHNILNSDEYKKRFGKFDKNNGYIKKCEEAKIILTEIIQSDNPEIISHEDKIKFETVLKQINESIDKAKKNPSNDCELYDEFLHLEKKKLKRRTAPINLLKQLPFEKSQNIIYELFDIIHASNEVGDMFDEVVINDNSRRKIYDLVNIYINKKFKSELNNTAKLLKRDVDIFLGTILSKNFNNKN